MGIDVSGFGVVASRDGVSLALTGTSSQKFGEGIGIKVKRADLREIFGLADASEAQLKVWLERAENMEALGRIASRMMGDGRSTVTAGLHIIEIPLHELREAKTEFRTEPVVVEAFCSR